MVRQRKKDEKLVRPKSSGDKGKKRSRMKEGASSVFITLLIGVGLLVVLFMAIQWWSARRIAMLYTPYSGERLVGNLNALNDTQERLWGSYRSHLYFGMRTRTPKSLLFGMAWFAQYPKDGQLHLRLFKNQFLCNQKAFEVGVATSPIIVKQHGCSVDILGSVKTDSKTGVQGFRYTCEQSDNLLRYGWLQHDGRTFGSQEIVDEDFVLTTDFLKRPGGNHGGDWTLRVKGKARDAEGTHQLVSLLFAVTDEETGTLKRVIKGGRMAEIRGSNQVLGDFKVIFSKAKQNVRLETFLAGYEEDVYNVKHILLKNLRYVNIGRKHGNEHALIGLPGDTKNDAGKAPNIFIYQATFALPFEIEVVFESSSFTSREQRLSDAFFTKLFSKQQETFEKKFENKFQLHKKGFNEEQISFAKAALSNMVGGIGYFYGNSIVKSRFLKKPVDYWSSGLYSAVPSRSFFPRGFLWDEGFHQLLISQWDRSISLDVLSHWLDLLNADGWIPREQILGVEARRKVPDEFVIQHGENANPPTLFLTIQSILEQEKDDNGNVTEKTREFLKKAYPRLKLWFSWYNTTQVGKVPSSYCWRGRDAKTDREINPKTLTSGLDDYPRASHPSFDERHVDLRCWITIASGILAEIASIVGESSFRFRSTYNYLADNERLDNLHWSTKQNAYCDYGNHTKFVALEPRSDEPGGPKRMVRVVRSKQGPSLKYIPVYGYVSLFPFLLQILKPSSPKLKRILVDIRKPELLWTQYGLRSLAKNDSFYMKRNTEHDPPYWRGPIWINMNYLAVRALQHYSDVKGPYQDLAKEIYKELRTNLINNIFANYKNTGYIYEQYNDKTGLGQGCYPFTGWSALVTLMMGEIY